MSRAVKWRRLASALLVFPALVMWSHLLGVQELSPVWLYQKLRNLPVQRMQEKTKALWQQFHEAYERRTELQRGTVRLVSAFDSLGGLYLRSNWFPEYLHASAREATTPLAWLAPDSGSPDHKVVQWNGLTVRMHPNRNELHILRQDALLYRARTVEPSILILKELEDILLVSSRRRNTGGRIRAFQATLLVDSLWRVPGMKMSPSGIYSISPSGEYFVLDATHSAGVIRVAVSDAEGVGLYFAHVPHGADYVWVAPAALEMWSIMPRSDALATTAREKCREGQVVAERIRWSPERVDRLSRYRAYCESGKGLYPFGF